MIGRLKGVVDDIRSDSLILDVNGVGYLVHCASNFLANLPAPGSPLSLYIETQVREDAITLFGFEQELEREWFRLLTTVQGVGARLALAILGTLGVEGVARAAALQDKNAFARTSGVGPKLAGRIANDLKDKGPGLGAGLARQTARTLAAASPDPNHMAFQDALSALVNLGYREPDASAALSRARHGLSEAIAPGAMVAELIRGGLKELAP
ncbi:MAG: Holliday junction branch migration protein RuvA [Alphaproteobacteria bacterium]|nr:Holliday junction branch migration protein RuvA [Alphaproteobacteria bacterium]